MKERAAAGETKIAAAKKALNRVIGSLPDDQSVGLRVYGAKVFSRDQPGACTDSQLVVPVDTSNRDKLRSAVASYRPYGETPIGHALQEAGKDLGGEGKRTIVLVSDGEPTCDPDPCEVARDLSQQGVDLKIDVVGLDVDGAARDKLRCIAGAGNGTYYDVDSSEEFAASLEKLATRARKQASKRAKTTIARARTQAGTRPSTRPTSEGAIPSPGRRKSMSAMLMTWPARRSRDRNTLRRTMSRLRTSAECMTRRGLPKAASRSRITPTKRGSSSPSSDMMCSTLGVVRSRLMVFSTMFAPRHTAAMSMSHPGV